MANTNTPYIAKNAAPLVNPTTATVFQQTLSPIATVSSTQVARVAYCKYAGYAQGGAGTSNNINLINIAVRAAGRMVFGAAGSFTPALVLAPASTAMPSIPPLTTATFTSIGALTPLAASGAGVGSWLLSANILWDPTSGVVSGSYSGYETTFVAGTPAQSLTALASITPTSGYIITPPLTTLPTTAAQAIAQANNGAELALFFAVTGLFSASNAANLAYQDILDAEDL